MAAHHDNSAAVLRTERLILRKLVAEDVEWLWELDSDPEVMLFITGGVPTPRTVLEEVLLPRMLARFPAGPQYGFWAATREEGGTPIGWFHVRPEREAPHDLELGYRLNRASWGQGLATEGSLEFLRRGFGEWGLSCVVAQTLALNRASRRVLEKCGFCEVGRFQYPAGWFPVWTEAQREAVRYQLRAEQWHSRDGQSGLGR